MQHSIETACPCSQSEREALQTVLADYPTAHVAFPTADQQKHWHIVITNANGAVLRDIVTALDRAGMLN